MSSTTTSRRPQVQRLALTGIGAAVLLVGIASPAGAATGVVVPMEPTEVLIGAFPIEDLAGMDPMADPDAALTPTPVPVEFDGELTVDLPAELDDSAVGAELVFDDNRDGTPEAVYSSSFQPANPNHLAVTGQGTGSITIDLPGDDPAVGDVAQLTLQPLESDLGPAFTSFGGVALELALETPVDPLTPATVTVEPVLVAVSQVPCELTSGERCPFPTPVTAGSTFTLDLTARSALRELGLTDLTGVQVGLQPLDADGFPTGATPAELDVQVSGSTASVAVPAGTAAGSYSLVVVQPTPSGGLSVFQVEITVEESAPAVVPPAAEPTTPAAAPSTTTTTVNAGLRSNTGVEAVPAGSTGTVAVVAGAGLLLAAGVGGVAVARTRRRPAGEVGSCGA